LGTVLSWLLLLPWFLVLFLDKEKVRQFISGAFLSSILNIIALHIGPYYNWWVLHPALPVLGELPTFSIGFSPVVALFVFSFTFPNVWLFFFVNLFLDAFQAYVVGPFVFEKYKIYTMTGMSNTGLFVVISSMIPIVYLYQLWYDREGTQERIFSAFPVGQ
jgi:hypothetical protein